MESKSFINPVDLGYDLHNDITFEIWSHYFFSQRSRAWNKTQDEMVEYGIRVKNDRREIWFLLLCLNDEYLNEAEKKMEWTGNEYYSAMELQFGYSIPFSCFYLLSLWMADFLLSVLSEEFKNSGYKICFFKDDFNLYSNPESLKPVYVLNL